MSAYGSIDQAKAGFVYGLDHNIETRVVPSGTTFAFGDPVFVDEGDEAKAYKADSNDASLKFLGVAIVSQRSFNDSQGEYVAYDTMNVLTRGEVYVTVPSGLSSIANKSAYVIDDQSNDDYEKFTTTAAGNYDCGCYFKSNPNSDNLVRIEVRGMK